MDSNSPTKKQHFVPKFYLKYFTNQKNLLQILEIKNNCIILPRTPSGVGYEKYFYAANTGVHDEISQQMEEWLDLYENIIANSLPEIISKILNFQHIDDDDKYILSSLMCMLWLRSPVMRLQINKMNEEITKKMFSFNVEESVDSFLKKENTQIVDAERRDLIDMLKSGSYKLRFNNAHHLRFMTKSFGFGGPGFVNMFFGHKWKIYLAKGTRRFITTDNPVVEWWMPSKTFYGASFLERNKYFALTPDIFIELSYPMGSDKIKRNTIFNDQDDTVGLYNILLASHSYEYVYSRDQFLLDDLIAGRKNPGKIEKIYYKRFEEPWAIARKEGRV